MSGGAVAGCLGSGGRVSGGAEAGCRCGLQGLRDAPASAAVASGGRPAPRTVARFSGKARPTSRGVPCRLGVGRRTLTSSGAGTKKHTHAALRAAGSRPHHNDISPLPLPSEAGPTASTGGNGPCLLRAAETHTPPLRQHKPAGALTQNIPSTAHREFISYGFRKYILNKTS